MNPFEITYRGIFEIGLQNTVLQQYIKANNYVMLDDGPNTKKSISSADLPELLLTQTACVPQLVASSSACRVVTTYNWVVTQGSWDLAHLSSELQWGLLTASSSWCSNLTLLQWKERPFIQNVEVANVDITVLDTEQNRGIQGWTINWPLNVTMNLPRNELRNYQWEPTLANTPQ